MFLQALDFFLCIRSVFLGDHGIQHHTPLNSMEYQPYDTSIKKDFSVGVIGLCIVPASVGRSVS